MDPSGVINDLGKQYIGPTQSSRGVKPNTGYFATAPIFIAALVSALAGAMIVLV